MTNKLMKVYKETAVPTVWEPDAIYFIKSVSMTYMEIYTTSVTGVPQRLINKTDIEALIASEISSANELIIVADIAARNALNPTKIINVYVEDATGDATVTSGGAYYLYKLSNSTWIKTAESESLDVILNWSAIQGKPTSSPASIDAAVANSHTHNNLTQLNKIAEDGNGNMTYNGSLPYTGWETTNW